MNRSIYIFTIMVCLFLAGTPIDLAAQDIIAKGGSLTVQYEGGGAETSARLIDNDVSTKYLTNNAAPLWIQWECTTAEVSAQYLLTSANDEQGRDPKSWVLEASDDASNWITLDTRTGEQFPGRLMTKAYAFVNTTPYKYYRLRVTAFYNEAFTTFQLAEWRLFEYALPAAPSGLTAVSSGGQEVFLQWSDNSIVESGFEIERSGDGVSYTLIHAADANASSFLDEEGLGINTSYHYRVRAVNTFGSSAYTNDVTVSTLPYSGASIDLTEDGGTLTVLYENGGTSENSAKLIDNNSGTKYLIPSGNPFPYWIQYESATGAGRVVTKYTLTSANDAATRDPKDWTFEGSSNGTSWVVLDTRTGITFKGRFQTMAFILNASAQYKYYRLNVSANGGSSIPGQIAEWEIGSLDPNAPAIPEILSAVAVSKTEVELAWEDNSNNETGFAIERSTDGVSFSAVTTIGAGETSYIDEGLTAGTTFYYRIKATGTPSASLYSVVASVTTPGINVAPTLDEIADRTTCNTTVVHTIDLTGISPGPASDADQIVSLSVSADHGELYEELSVSEIVDGKATLSFKISEEATAVLDTIRVTVKDDGGSGNGGIDTSIRKFTVDFQPLPIAITLSTDLPVTRGATVELKATGAETYTWGDGPGIVSGISSDVLVIYPTQSYRYTVTGQTEEGCTRSENFLVEMEPGYLLEPVNILTPDNDGKNDKWIIWNIHGFAGNEVMVYDRAGKVVFNKKDYTNDWNGTYNGSPLANDVYFYVINLGSGIKPLKGTLTIIRDVK